jgi:hypothetical protein
MESLKALLDLLPLLMALSLMLLHRRARRRPEPLPSFLIMMMSNFEPLGVRLWAINENQAGVELWTHIQRGLSLFALESKGG